MWWARRIYLYPSHATRVLQQNLPHHVHGISQFQPRNEKASKGLSKGYRCLPYRFEHRWCYWRYDKTLHHNNQFCLEIQGAWWEQHFESCSSKHSGRCLSSPFGDWLICEARIRMVIAYLFAQTLPLVRGRTASGSLLVLGSANVDEVCKTYPI